MATTTELDPSFYESRAVVPIAVVTIVLSLATVTVALRTYTCAVIIHQFGMDDGAAIIALLFAIDTIYGVGRHIEVTFSISIVLYNASLTAIKIAFLLQYHRILVIRHMRRVVIAALTFVSLWSISELPITIFNCVPIEKFWLADSAPETCIPNLLFWYHNTAGNILTDVIVFVLPLPALGGLNLRKSQKIMLLGIFSLGFFDNVKSSCWFISELCSGIICACLPTFRPLLIKFFPSMESADRSGTYYNKQSYGRDGTFDSGRAKTTETSSSRGIVYYENVELRGHDSDEDEAVGVNHIRVGDHGPHDRARSRPDPLRKPYVQDKLRLKPAVLTEIAAGALQHPSGWGHTGDRGIKIKRGFTITIPVDTCGIFPKTSSRQEARPFSAEFAITTVFCLHIATTNDACDSRSF
ncbi:hypothetical protein B0H67DRAFT_639320 [Lasiosphaeris hirsuta]|uniref:Rhodopsin domain-containing protein n=1 Tax=Lasiosphaeris hirsuta TaxID=260670 RepID=A0AA40BB09_9PEZI|nr:hypothetical protein B0H67DRAFT_639320 [Lasiosphaeris hirsuta]